MAEGMQRVQDSPGLLISSMYSMKLHGADHISAVVESITLQIFR